MDYTYITLWFAAGGCGISLASHKMHGNWKTTWKERSIIDIGIILLFGPIVLIMALTPLFHTWRNEK